MERIEAGQDQMREGIRTIKRHSTGKQQFSCGFRVQ